MSDNPTMLSFSEDIASAEAPKPLPAGEYPFTITGADVKDSAKGTKYIAVQLHISPDAFPADFDSEPYPDGLKLSYMRLSAEDNALARYSLRQFIEAIGAPAGKTIDIGEWIGLAGIARVKTTVYEGRDRNEVDKITRA